MLARLSLLPALFLMLTPPSPALDIGGDLQPIGAVTSWDSDARGVTLHCQDGSTVRVAVLAPDLVRVRAAFRQPLPPRDHSWAVAKEDWPATPFQSRQEPGRLRLTTGQLQVVVQENPLRLQFLDSQGHLLDGDEEPMGFDARGVYSQQLYDPAAGPLVALTRTFAREEHFYGLGEKASRLDKRRGAFSMWNSDTPGYKEDTDPIYQSIPFYLGLNQGRAFGLFLDNSYRSHFDFGHISEEHIRVAAEGGELNYYFFSGPEMTRILERYTELTGRAPLAPRWALGHQTCRWSYYPDSRVEQIVDGYREHDLPLDAIYLDIHHMQDYRVFTWSRQRFPDPAGLIKRLADRGVKTITIVDPGVKHQPASSPAPPAGPRPELDDQSGHYYAFDQGLAGDYFMRRRDGSLLVGNVWPGPSVFVDYTREDARRWWGGLHRAYTDYGVAGIWNDMNEPADFIDRNGEKKRDALCHDGGERTGQAKNRNVLALLEGWATYEGLRRLRPNQRPFIVTRAGFAGQQRYTAMWTGDTPSSWESLALTVPMYTSLGLSGETFVGGDIGGYTGRCDGELLVRSYQAGFLAPFCRTHKEIGGYDQEPWRFGPYYEGIIRRYLKLRYQLLPYLYAAMEESYRSGLPALRPLILYDQHDPQLHNLDDELMVGPDLLLAPVLHPAQESRRVYLPRGEWYDLGTSRRLQGGRFLVRPTPLETVPLFVRAGSVLPMAQEGTRVESAWRGPLALHLYPDSQGRARGSLYDDDGQSEDYTRGQWARRQVVVTRVGKSGLVSLTAWQGGYRPSPRPYSLIWHGERPLKGARLDGHPAKVGPHNDINWPDDGQAHKLELLW